MVHLLCLETMNLLSTLLLFLTLKYTSATMHSTTIAHARLLPLASPASITVLALLILWMSFVNTGDLCLHGKPYAILCFGEVTPRQLPLRDFLVSPRAHQGE